MRRTKKEFLTHYNDLFFTVEFYHGERGTFFGSRGMEDATETAVKCSMRGGICFTFPQKYQKAIWTLIDQREHETKHRIDVDFFKSNLPAYIEDVDNVQ